MTKDELINLHKDAQKAGLIGTALGCSLALISTCYLSYKIDKLKDQFLKEKQHILETSMPKTKKTDDFSINFNEESKKSSVDTTISFAPKHLQ